MRLFALHSHVRLPVATFYLMIHSPKIFERCDGGEFFAEHGGSLRSVALSNCIMSHVSHDRSEETAVGKARWFRSLSLEERMEYLCAVTDLIFENAPRVVEKKNAQSLTGRVLVLTKTSR